MPTLSCLRGLTLPRKERMKTKTFVEPTGRQLVPQFCQHYVGDTVNERTQPAIVLHRELAFQKIYKAFVLTLKLTCTQQTVNGVNGAVTLTESTLGLILRQE